MKTIALVNPASGGVTVDGAERMREALEAAGLKSTEVVEIDLDACENQMSLIADSDPDLFIVWGGDGTLRSALSTVGKKTPNLVLLPGGTMNLLTKSLHGDKPWNTILNEVIAGPRQRKITAGEINGEIFYCAMLAGAPARFAEARESIRKGEIGKGVAAARAALDTLQTIHLNARYGEGYSFTDDYLPTTSVIGALVGPLVKSGRMEIAALAEPTTMSALNVVWTSFLSDWRDAPGVTIVAADTLVIESEEGDDIPVIIDGEPLEAGNRVSVKFVEEAGQCLTAS
ncbi:MAG: diacylglycerol kinase family protein [Alphaproteobacteria bacterium]|nr:diacylglycerol kinase family protein [Alphaproteobacteria bacterium]